MQTNLPHPKTESALAAMFISSGVNKSNREQFALLLMQKIKVDSYGSEKFFEPLIVGSVPVYLGAPNIAEYAPAPKSFINVHDFSSVDKLAEYLTFLSNNEAEYNQYLTWKKNGISESFI